MKTNTYDQSLRAILDHCQALDIETAPFAACLGRVIAEDIRAGENDPPQPKSSMDGFALRSEDTAHASPDSPVRMTFDEVVGAGHLARGEVTRGSAIRLMTGALVPAGADAVVKQEDTTPDEAGAFRVTAPLRFGENVIAPGTFLRRDTPLLFSGEVIGPQAMASLAGQGRSQVRVRRKPRVALLAMGDELVEIGNPLAPGQIYMSNGYLLEALCVRYGATGMLLGVVRDNLDDIEHRLRGCLPGEAREEDAQPCDVVVTLGGSHQGDFDFAGPVLDRLGATVHFRQTLINYGGSTWFATRGNTLFFGLPGTPGASWLAFEVLIRPALMALQGRQNPNRPLIRARLAQSHTTRPGRLQFVPVAMAFSEDGPPMATPLTREHPAPRPAGLLANGLIRLAEDAQPLKAGDWVNVEWMGAH